MAKFSITTKGQLVSKNFNKKLKKDIEKRFSALLKEGIEQIWDRTSKGKNILGQNFPRYSESYIKQRRKKGLQTSPVDLQVTKKMRRSTKSRIRTRGDRITGEIFIQDDRGKVEGIQKKRPFLGLSQEFQKLIGKFFKTINLKGLNS